MSKSKIVVSGMRATGKMHLGHYEGALKNWVALQEQYHCYFFVAEWHAVFSEFKDTAALRANAVEMVRDWLAAGLDPKKCTIFLQTDVPGHAELFLILAPFVPVGWLERCPTYKEAVENLTNKEVTNYGFFGYPVLQAADIMLYKGEYVPVGEDQVVHLELTREIVRRFNQFYPGCFPEPKPLLTKTSRLLGTDNRKMSKSYGNFINLDMEKDAITRVAKTMVTDHLRVRLKDPGHPDACNVFSYYNIFAPQEAAAARDWCENAKKGCMDCKTHLAGCVDSYIAPLRERRQQYSDDAVLNIMHEGAARARQSAAATMRQLRDTLHLKPLLP